MSLKFSFINDEFIVMIDFILFHSERVKTIMTDGQNRAQIKSGQTVSIFLKKDQRTGALTQGVVKTILTKSPFHPHGIKVRLKNGLVGRVKVIHG